jgi:2,3-bisphosphoglycerate-dependent phosphoglycerate mutase
VAAVLEAAAGGKRCVIVTHGNLLALLLKWVDDQVGYEFWSGLLNPDLFVIDVGDPGRRTFRRVLS